jgi:hypothetical protein
MNIKIEKLLTDMVIYFDYRVNVEPSNYVKKAENKIGRIKTATRLLSLFSWVDPRDYPIPNNNQEKYEIYDEEVMEQEDFEEVYSEFKQLFENFPELTELFALKERHVEFNPSLTKEDIQEVYDFVKTNNNVPPRDYQFRRR